MVELVDTPDLGSGAAMRVGSSPIRRTKAERSPINRNSSLLLCVSHKLHRGGKVLLGQRIFPVDRPLIKNKPKSVISVMMIIVLFLNLFVKPIERTQTCLKLALARKGRI